MRVVSRAFVSYFPLCMVARRFAPGVQGYCPGLPDHHTMVAKIITCSFSARELISDYSYSWGGGTEFISNYSYSRGGGAELFSNYSHSRGGGSTQEHT